jgi:hypothetical protein
MFSLAADGHLPPDWRDALRQQLSRNGHGTIAEHDAPGVYLAKLDLGAFDTPAWQVGKDAVVAMCGDSLLPQRVPGGDRNADVDTLSSSTFDALPGLLRHSRGTFALAAIRTREPELVLATDRLGVRPIYVLKTGTLVVFAAALRIIESLPGVKLTADLQGTLEEAAFGISIGDRTRYADVKSLRGGTILRIRRDSQTAQEYWRWDTGACDVVTEDTRVGLENLHAAFAAAVRLRTGNHKSVFAALSGGLDSRCVVTELRAQGIDVHSLNVSWQSSQDEVYGRLYAEAVGTQHHQTTLPDSEVGAAVARLLYESLQKLAPLLGSGPGSKRLWGGDGGSVGIGHVYLTPQIVRLMRESGAQAAADAFLRHNRLALARRAFRSGYGSYVASLPLRSMMDELKRFECRDPGRALYVFLLENDQRRHLASHFERLDLFPYELVEPFYDPEVLTAACRLPLDYCLRHHMYYDWLRTFPAPAYTIPWQAYPTHEPCPIPVSDTLMSQFGQPRAALTAARRTEAKAEALAALQSASRLYSYLRVPVVIAAYVGFRLRIAEPLYVFKQVHVLSRVLNKCEGRVQADAPGLRA